jgi:hypothetical protein
MSLTEILLAAPKLVLLLAGLMGPGTLLLRACRLPWSLAGSFVSSCALLYLVVLGCVVFHLPISLLSLLLGLAIFSAAFVVIMVRRRGAVAPDETIPGAFLTSLRGWTPLYVAFWVIVLYRLTTDPLSGPDVHFRWSYLAEQMLRHGSLDFYPPQSGEDFVRYFWPESIPPGIAGVYAWAYGCAGSFNPLWTAPVVLLQLLSLHDVIWRLAYRHGGGPAARNAVLLAAACPLLTWSFLIGQETGLLAVAVVGLVWCLDRSREAKGTGWAVLGGVFAVAAASTREYGLVYAVMAVAAATVMAGPGRNVCWLAAVALPATAIWPARVWLATGNPFFSLDLGGFFPTNSVFIAWNDIFRSAQRTTLSSAASWGELARYLLLWALPASLGAVAMLALFLRRSRGALLVAAFAALAAGLWLMSVAYTAGGLFYSLRVLAPALALSIVAAGWASIRLFASPRAVRWLAVGLALMSLEALPKTLVLPDNPYRVPVREWPDASRRITESFHAANPELAARLARLPGRRRVASDSFDLPGVGATVGVEVAPLWSPGYSWLFDNKMDPADAARRWVGSGLRFIVVGRTGAMRDFVQTHAPGRTPYYTIEVADETSSHVILEIKPTGLPVPP